MEKPAVPASESERLADLQALDVLDTLAEERFDRITRLAKGLFQVPIALISLVDDKRQWFKSRQGLTACETPREISFCGHAILSDEVLWVEDASQDERFADNPLVVQEPNIRFYAGVPLRSRGGHNLGTLCVIDDKPRKRSAAAIAQLVDLGQLAESELASLQLGRNRLELADRSPARRRENIDGPTGVWNRKGMLEVLELSLEACSRKQWPGTVLLGQLEHRSKTGAAWTERGNEIIIAEVAQVLRSSIREFDSIGRIEDDQFLVMLAGLGEEQAAARIAHFQRRVDENPVLEAIGVRVHFGHACWEAGAGADDPIAHDSEALLEAASRSLASSSQARRGSAAA